MLECVNFEYLRSYVRMRTTVEVNCGPHCNRKFPTRRVSE